MYWWQRTLLAAGRIKSYCSDFEHLYGFFAASALNRAGDNASRAERVQARQQSWCPSRLVVVVGSKCCGTGQYPFPHSMDRSPAFSIIVAPRESRGTLVRLFERNTSKYTKKENYPTCNSKTLETEGSIFPRWSKIITIESLCFLARPTRRILFILLNLVRQSGCRFQSKWMCMCARLAFLLQGHSSRFLFSVSPKISFFLTVNTIGCFYIK